MAKKVTDVPAQCGQLIEEIKAGVFRPVYLLMGDEPFYPEMVCEAIIDNCLEDYEKDFNQTICYGADVNAEQVITAARRFPMMAERQLVVVKEAQMMKTLEDLSIYCADPLDSTVLVILMHKATADGRKSLFKSVQKVGVVIDSPAVKDYELPRWISSYYSSLGLRIAPDAAALLGESTGTDLSTIAAETDKLRKNLPEGTIEITAQDVEKNVGISRQFSIYELTKQLSERNAAKALKTASHIGSAAKFAMPMAVSALYTHFYRILKYGAMLSSGARFSEDDKAKALGVKPYFLREYDTAVRNYPVKKAMQIISLLCEYDFLGKGGNGEENKPGDLLTELVCKILS